MSEVLTKSETRPRFSLAFAGREYRVGEAENLPPAFAKIAKQLREKMTVPVGTKAELFASHHRRKEELAAMRGQAEQFFRQVSLTAGFTQETAAMRRIHKPPIACFHLAEEEPKTIHAELRKSVEASIDELVGDAVDCLDQLVGMQHVGLVEWSKKDKDVCHFYFTRRTVEEKRERSGGQVNVTQTHSLTLCIHDLVQAQTYYLDSQVFQHLSKPMRVQELLRHVPAWLSRSVWCLAGTLIHELLIRRDIKTESWTEPIPVPAYYHDPGIVIADYVLAGWQNGEM